VNLSAVGNEARQPQEYSRQASCPMRPTALVMAHKREASPWPQIMRLCKVGVSRRWISARSASKRSCAL